jgi:hypothetical protein
MDTLNAAAMVLHESPWATVYFNGGSGVKVGRAVGVIVIVGVIVVVGVIVALTVAVEGVASVCPTLVGLIPVPRVRK